MFWYVSTKTDFCLRSEAWSPLFSVWDFDYRSENITNVIILGDWVTQSHQWKLSESQNVWTCIYTICNITSIKQILYKISPMKTNLRSPIWRYFTCRYSWISISGLPVRSRNISNLYFLPTGKRRKTKWRKSECDFYWL